MVTFSIIIPMYNAQSYIEDCLDSVLNQTYKNYEIIVVDDGSNDDSIAIVNRYQSKYEYINLRLIQEEHKNAGAARNVGMEAAQGDYLLFLDSDDKFSYSLLENIVLAIGDGEKKDIIVWNGSTFDNKTGEIKDVDYLLDLSYVPCKNVFSPIDNAKYLYQFTAGTVWNKAFLNCFIREKNIKFQEIRKANDIYFSFAAMVHATSIRIINKKLVFYRYNNEKSLQGEEKGRNIDFYWALMKVKQELEEKNFYGKFKLSFDNICLVHCINELYMRHNGDDFAFIYRCLKEYMIKNLGFQELREKTCYSLPYYEMMNKVLNKSLESFLFDEFSYFLDMYKQLKENNRKKIWPFPYDKILPKTKVVLYGAGDMGQDFERQIRETEYCNLVLWVDKKYEKFQEKGIKVESPYEIDNTDYEMVVIAVNEEEIRNDIVRFLMMIGVKKNKII